MARNRADRALSLERHESGFGHSRAGNHLEEVASVQDDSDQPPGACGHLPRLGGDGYPVRLDQAEHRVDLDQRPGFTVGPVDGLCLDAIGNLFVRANRRALRRWNQGPDPVPQVERHVLVDEQVEKRRLLDPAPVCRWLSEIRILAMPDPEAGAVEVGVGRPGGLGHSRASSLSASTV